MVLRSRARPRTYQLQRRVAAGGMGEVYSAFSPDLNRKVAVKRMLEARAEEEDLKLMFLREVAVAATLEHPNVVEVLDAGETDHELFLVMELVDGPSLAEIVEVLRRQNKILPIEVSCHIVSCVALGLAHAHARALPDGTPLGIIHRDVAPENVLIGTDGIPKVVDFGLAKLSGHSLTEPGIIRGRPRSLSPEQARGDPVTVRSDIFSLGAMLFELTAGQPLYGNEAVASLLWKVAAGQYDALEPRLRHIEEDLVEIIRVALSVDPAGRFRSAREMERALDGFRAARGMRVSSRALAQVVTITWPTILELRAERMEGHAGELESQALTLPADAEPERPTADPLNPTGGYSIPKATVGPVTPAAPAAAANPLAAGLAAPSGRPVAPAALPSELPKPSMPRGRTSLVAQVGGWRLYAAVVAILALLAFGGVLWLSAPSAAAPTQLGRAAPPTDP